ncbi:MAG: methyl-accepting chemotaxis protein [Synergistaceae bacterium]|nr:methyl-accepting chemotaxis protein [Synergistaceae bacterium]
MKKNLKIRTKLFLLTFTAMVIIVSMVLTVYVRSSSVLIDISTLDALARAESEAHGIDLYFAGLNKINDSAAPGVAMCFDREGNFSEDVLQRFLAVLSDTNDVHSYVGIEGTGQFISGQNMVPPEGYDPRARPWYKDAVAANKTIMTPPYEDAITKDLVVTIATPIRGAERKLIGVLASDIFISELSTRVSNIQTMGVGFGVLIGPDGVFLKHPNSDFIMKENVAQASSNITPELAAVGRKMLAAKSGQSAWEDYFQRGARQRMFYCPGEGGFIIGVVISHKEIGTIVGRMTMVLVVAGVVALVLLITFMFFMIPTIVKPLRVVEKSLARIAGLDLSADPDAERFESGVNAATEVGGMILSLRGLRRSFNEVIKSVSESVGMLASSSGTLDSLSDKANTEISEAKNALKILGLEISDTIEFNLNITGDKRTLVKIKKSKKTPPEYPRNFSVIIKNPL